jgi:hypothetical protein
MLKSKLFRTTLNVLSVLIILYGIAAMISPVTFVPGYENEATEIPAEFNALGFAPLQATQNAFPASALTLPDVYHPSYNPKNRCRIEYQFTGGALLSQVLETHVEITQAPGTPGGTTATATTVDTDFAIITFKVISTKEVNLQEMKEAAVPPKGWFLGDWSTDERFLPEAVITFQNCLNVPTKPVPRR